MTADRRKTKPVTVKLPYDAYRALRMIATDADRTLAETIAELAYAHAEATFPGVTWRPTGAPPFNTEEEDA